MRRLGYVLVCFSLVLAAHATQSAPAPQVTGIYSNLRLIPSEGDVVGTEVFILSSGTAYFVLVQCAEGVLGPPELLPATVEYPTVKFTVPEHTASMCLAGEFEGTLTSRGLNGAVRGSDWPGFLPRKKSFWQ